MKKQKNKIANSLCRGTYLMKHISGKEVIVNNFTQFCRENNLHQGRMNNKSIVTGKQIGRAHV